MVVVVVALVAWFYCTEMYLKEVLPWMSLEVQVPKQVVATVLGLVVVVVFSGTPGPHWNLESRLWLQQVPLATHRALLILPIPVSTVVLFLASHWIVTIPKSPTRIMLTWGLFRDLGDPL